MNYKEIKNELKNIIHGKSKVSHGEFIQTIALYLRRSKTTSAVAETEQYHKKQETAELIQYINSNHLWVCDINFDLFTAVRRIFPSYVRIAAFSRRNKV